MNQDLLPKQDPPPKYDPVGEARKERKRRRNDRRVFFWVGAALFAALGLVFFSNIHPVIEFFRGGMDERLAVVGFLLGLALVTWHCVSLFTSKTLTTFTARRRIDVLIYLFVLPAAFFSLAGGGWALFSNTTLFEVDLDDITTSTGVLESLFQFVYLLFISVSACVLALVLGFFVMAPLRAFSIPCNRISFIPLFLTLGALVLYPIQILFIFAGNRFPMHRRMVEYWRPRRLPKLRPGGARPNKGMTLIELLIAVAIVAIFTAGLVNATSSFTLAMERQQDRRTALEVAEDQIALLRATGYVPPVGKHPLSGELKAHYPKVVSGSDLEVLPGPRPGLREIRVHVPLEYMNEKITIAALVALDASGTSRTLSSEKELRE